jgi:putative addiction module killer protein
MIEVQQTIVFRNWLISLRDKQAAARIQIRIDRLALGLFGDVKPIGAGLSELRVDFGPGYRVYLVQRGSVYVLLLCGGDKRTQQADIGRAQEMAKELKNAP